MIRQHSTAGMDIHVDQIQMFRNLNTSMDHVSCNKIWADFAGIHYIVMCMLAMLGSRTSVVQSCRMSMDVELQVECCTMAMSGELDMMEIAVVARTDIDCCQIHGS